LIKSARQFGIGGARLWHDSFIRVTHLILWTWHDASICELWLIYMRDLTRLFADWNVHADKWLYTHVHVLRCIVSYIYVYLHAGNWLCTYVYTYIHTFICMYIHTNTYMYIYMDIFLQIHTYVYVYVYIFLQAGFKISPQARGLCWYSICDIHINLCTYTLLCIRRHICICTYMYV